MKLLILLLSISSMSFAQGSFLTQSEASKVNNYMDSICPDTYCGGDVQFYTKGMSCMGSTCVLNFYGSGYSLFNDNRADELQYQTKTSVFNEKTKIKYATIKIQPEEEFDIVDMYFTCILQDLPLNDELSYTDKREMVYDRVVFECIRDLEEDLYSWID